MIIAIIIITGIVLLLSSIIDIQTTFIAPLTIVIPSIILGFIFSFKLESTIHGLALPIILIIWQTSIVLLNFILIKRQYSEEIESMEKLNEILISNGITTDVYSRIGKEAPNSIRAHLNNTWVSVINKETLGTESFNKIINKFKNTIVAETVDDDFIFTPSLDTFEFTKPKKIKEQQEAKDDYIPGIGDIFIIAIAGFFMSYIIQPTNWILVFYIVNIFLLLSMTMSFLVSKYKEIKYSGKTFESKYIVYSPIVFIASLIVSLTALFL